VEREETDERDAELFINNGPMSWGNRLERVVADAFAESTGFSLVSWSVTLLSEEPGMEFMAANVDFFLVETSENFPAGVVTEWIGDDAPPGIFGVMDSKTTGIASRGKPEDWADGKHPLSYALQLIHYGLVLGVEELYLAALVAGEGLVIRKVEWDEEMAEKILSAEASFYEMVLSGQPPVVDGNEVTAKVIEKLYPRHTAEKVVDLGLDFYEAASEYYNIKEQIKPMNERSSELRSYMLSQMGDAEIVRVDGKPIVSFKNNKDGTKFSAEKFREEYPDLYQNFVVSVPGARVLRDIRK
jgi:predicted phage-related endonuclease